MRRIKRRIFSGCVLEQIVYRTADGVSVAPKATKPRIRFRDEAERAAHREAQARRAHAREFNANFAPTSDYWTLTFDDEHEVHDFKTVKRLVGNFMRRLRRRHPDAVIFWYTGRGVGTQRIHLHMVAEGVARQTVDELWRQGDVRRVEKLREHNVYDGTDYGRDYTGLANYLYKHWTVEQGGHRYHKVGNVKKYNREDASEVKRFYSEDKPPRSPEGYILVEAKRTGFDYLYFKYILEPVKKKKQPPGGGCK